MKHLKSSVYLFLYLILNFKAYSSGFNKHSNESNTSKEPPLEQDHQDETPQSYLPLMIKKSNPETEKKDYASLPPSSQEEEQQKLEQDIHPKENHIKFFDNKLKRISKRLLKAKNQTLSPKFEYLKNNEITMKLLFATKTEDNAPSLYFELSNGEHLRIRQQHESGPLLDISKVIHVFNEPSEIEKMETFMDEIEKQFKESDKINLENERLQNLMEAYHIVAEKNENYNHGEIYLDKNSKFSDVHVSSGQVLTDTENIFILDNKGNNLKFSEKSINIKLQTIEKEGFNFLKKKIEDLQKELHEINTDAASELYEEILEIGQEQFEKTNLEKFFVQEQAFFYKNPPKEYVDDNKKDELTEIDKMSHFKSSLDDYENKFINKMSISKPSIGDNISEKSASSEDIHPKNIEATNSPKKDDLDFKGKEFKDDNTLNWGASRELLFLINLEEELKKPLHTEPIYTH